MNQLNSELRLSLTVENPQALQQSSKPGHNFSIDGGIIGSRQDANWLLLDRSGRVRPHHCEIRYEDKGFIVIDRCGETILNDQMQPLGVNGSARLSNGDRLRIGPYRVVAHLDHEPHHLPDPDRTLAEHDLNDFVHASADYMDSLPSIDPDASAPEYSQQQPGWAEFQALSEPPAPQGMLDPLEALNATRDAAARMDAASSNLDPRHYGQTPLAAQADVTTTRFEAIYGPPLHAPGEHHMLEQDAPTPVVRDWLQRQLSNNTDPATLVEPLVDGIGAPVGAIDGEEAYALLNEAGRTLAAIIHGLSALNTNHPGEQQKISLVGRTLQPIEDNPLRLGQSYPDTVRSMFSVDRSVVHLSPSAAVEESLEQIRRQQVAVHKAITAGLDALLQAFSPEQLQQRFRRYRNANTGHTQGSDWAWRMYGHYYNELTSGRQQGFDKLFWEVFEQAFDQALRTEE